MGKDGVGRLTCRYDHRFVDVHLVSQYSVVNSRMVCSAGSSSVQSRNFSPIHASRASGLERNTKPMVAGLVACSMAYAVPVAFHSSRRTRPSFSAEESLDSSSWEVGLLSMQKFTVEDRLVCWCGFVYRGFLTMDGFACLGLDTHDSRDPAAYIAALSDVAVSKAQFVHQLVHDTSGVDLAEVFAHGLGIGKSIPRQARNDEVILESLGRVLVSQEAQHGQELEKRARPTMDENHRNGVRCCRE